MFRLFNFYNKLFYAKFAIESQWAIFGLWCHHIKTFEPWLKTVNQALWDEFHILFE